MAEYRFYVDQQVLCAECGIKMLWTKREAGILATWILIHSKDSLCPRAGKRYYTAPLGVNLEELPADA